MTLRSVTTSILFSAIALVAPAALSAQITTFVAPPRKAVVDSTKQATVAQARGRADSVARMSLSDMKAWVDSAAGVNTNTQVASASDTVMSPTPNATTPASAQNAASSGATTTTFSNGAIAPNTATPLPGFIVAGILSLGAGLLALRLARRRV